VPAGATGRAFDPLTGIFAAALPPMGQIVIVS
jgi:hypothetical protein